MNRPRIVSLEGNIGAGKSTLLSALKERYANRNDVIFVEEPVGIWESIQQDGLNMLQLFYKDTCRYAFTFQILAFTTRLKLLKDAIKQANESEPPVKTIIMERSLEADRNIFAKMLNSDKQMQQCEYDIYVKMSDDILQDYSVDGIVWINTPPDECVNRIKNRNREGEETISFDYLLKCHENHVEWLGADTGFVHIIEDNRDEKIWIPLEKYLWLD
jgi:deoxyadenosine/deoxycytidine kinase